VSAPTVLDGHACSHAGVADNPAIGEEEIVALERSLAHDPAQLAARLHGRFTRPVGLALRFDPERHYERMDEDSVAALIERGKPMAGIDFGAWRFAFVFAVVDRLGRIHVTHEIFSQRNGVTAVGETLAERAAAIDALLTRLEIGPGVPIWGDLANTQDIIEINAEFRRLGSGYVVMPVAAENKIRTTSVERLNGLLERDALLVRRSIGEDQVWRLGQSAAREGDPVLGSRLTWEIGAWRYPEPSRSLRPGVEERAQGQDPADDTADGADMIAALRYMVMSWWTAAKGEKPRRRAWDRQVLREEAGQKRRIRRGKVAFGDRGSRKPRHPEFGEL